MTVLCAKYKLPLYVLYIYEPTSSSIHKLIIINKTCPKRNVICNEKIPIYYLKLQYILMWQNKYYLAGSTPLKMLDTLKMFLYLVVLYLYSNMCVERAVSNQRFNSDSTMRKSHLCSQTSQTQQKSMYIHIESKIPLCICINMLPKK